jgi:Xaa-Pro aminopeptidase
MVVTTGTQKEADVRAAMEHIINANEMTCAYRSIVTVRGEVLHNEHITISCNREICYL